MPLTSSIRSRNLLLTGALMFCVVPSLAYAARCGGTNINNLISWDQSEIAKGMTLAVMRTASVIYSDDVKADNHLAAGECIGSFLTGPDGRTLAQGQCARKDKDGDVLYEEWVATDGKGNKGSSRNIGGTGKYAKAASSMQWEFSPLHGKMGAVRWTGDCQ